MQKSAAGKGSREQSRRHTEDEGSYQGGWSSSRHLVSHIAQVIWSRIGFHYTIQTKAPLYSQSFFGIEHLQSSDRGFKLVVKIILPFMWKTAGAWYNDNSNDLEGDCSLNTHTLLCELAAFAVYFLYGSYFEWVFHRYLFHSPKYVYQTFRAHTLVHHQLYKGDHTYHTDDEHPEHVPMDWWAVLAMVAWHLPFFWLFQKFTGIPSLWAASRPLWSITACTKASIGRCMSPALRSS